MSLLRIVFVVALLAAAAACETVGTVREVDRMKALAQSGDVDALVTYQVTCVSGTEGCDQAHMIKADACLQRAQSVGVVGRIPYASCAAEGYEAALDAAAASGDGRVDGDRLARSELEALRLWRDAASRSEGTPINRRLGAAGGQVGDRQPARPEGPYYEADSLLWLVNAGIAQPPCPTLALAQERIIAARAAAAAGTVDVGQLDRDLANTARVAGCELGT
ncbi:MAG: hypothetical protein AAFX81_13150 [Pseudomonadota bacterium]